MKFVKLIVVAAIILGSQLSFAGWQNNTTVTITSSSFYGSLRASRDSANNTEYLACYVNGQTDAITCFARDASSNYKSCTIAAPDDGDYATVSAVSSSTYLYVAFSGGTCTRVQATNGSYNLP
ncbi:MAG: hypothetical protein HWE11_10235 [Gammaproteobacteria bacterium]|nr:hypothetical protein [Gammaproteobacteria bacterium]